MFKKKKKWFLTLWNILKNITPHRTSQNRKGPGKHRNIQTAWLDIYGYPAWNLQQILYWSISKRTIPGCLVAIWLNGTAAPKRPLLRKIQRKRRFEFAKFHLNWTANEWKYVLWSDETKENRLGPDGRRFIRRPMNQEFNPRYVSRRLQTVGSATYV